MNKSPTAGEGPQKQLGKNGTSYALEETHGTSSATSGLTEGVSSDDE